MRTLRGHFLGWPCLKTMGFSHKHYCCSISSSTKLQSSPMQSAPQSPPLSLRSWIIKQYQSFNHDLAAENLENWVVCVGNEAGDLDTVASSIAFAYFSSLLTSPGSANRQYIPVQQTKSTEFKLRPENVHVLGLTNLLDDNTKSLPMPELICSDRLDFTKLTPYGAKYALLDHNQINKAIFGNSAEVVAVIDHHQAEAGNTLYLSANPRLIKVPTGSCASLVTTHFASLKKPLTIPPPLADLLLSAIALDTHNFKRTEIDDKTTDTDIFAKEWLLPRSRFRSSQTSAFSTFSGDSDFTRFFQQIRNLKRDISSLNSVELLKRDYKEYAINGWSLGICSVPTSLEHWIGEKLGGDWVKFLDELKQYADTKKLDVASVLTDPPKIKKSKSYSNQPKPHRVLVLMVINPNLSQITNSIEQQNPTIQSDSSLGFLASEIQDPASIDAWSSQHHVSVRVLKAEYPIVSRKQVAPALITLIEGFKAKSDGFPPAFKSVQSDFWEE